MLQHIDRILYISTNFLKKIQWLKVHLIVYDAKIQKYLLVFDHVKVMHMPTFVNVFQVPAKPAKTLDT